MEGKTEDEVVDVESASGGSVNDDSDDEGSLPSEIDDKLHHEVSHVYVSSCFSLSFFMAKFGILYSCRKLVVFY
jgi:hypothetical protein